MDDDVVLLDVFTAIYVWVGGGANEQERGMSRGFAERFVREVSGCLQWVR